MKIDAHQHFWNYDPSKHIWMNEEMKGLKKDFLPEEYKKEIQANGIDGSIAIQASQSEEETEFLLNLATMYQFIRGVVGWADLRASNIEDRLAYFSARESKIKGFRHVVHDEPDLNFMAGKEFKRGIRFLEKYKFSYDILIFPVHLENAMDLVKSFPHQRFVIDHIAKPWAGDIDDWKKNIVEIGKYENVYCKISGLVTEVPWYNWRYEDFTPFLDLVVESFGINKLMFGSDWPVCLLSGSYSQVKGIVERYFSGFTETEKTNIFEKNAISFYEINN
jgi:L-fuconolactonase